MTTPERIVIWTPAFDRRDPNPSKNYGVHGVDLRFILKGQTAATQFVIYTNWQLKHVRAEWDARDVGDHYGCRPMAADIGYHSTKPLGEWSNSLKCDLFGECYYDGSSLNAEPVFDRFVAEGEEAIWTTLGAFLDETIARQAEVVFA